MWPLLGAVVSAALVLTSLWRARSRASTYYERDVYGMTPATHAWYALAFAGFTAAFAAALFVRGFPVMPALGALALTGLIYGTSFLRGASGEDE